MIDKIAEVSLLYDFYGQLLTERQREVMRLYYEENYSLSEIAKEYDISRQGVHDTLKKAERALHEYEEKLGLVEKLEKTGRAIREIEACITKMAEEHTGDEALGRHLDQISGIIRNLEQLEQ